MNGLLAQLLAASHARSLQPLPKVAARLPRASLAASLQGRDRLSLLAEFKRRSPSDHELAPRADLVTQLQDYETGGAAGVSVLTEPTRFAGSLQDLQLAAATTALPILRKDFLVRPEQVVEAHTVGASAVLLIARCLPGAQLQELVAASRSVGIEVLIECHDAAEVERALLHDDAMIGINNRDLDSLRIDRGVTLRLASLVPSQRIVVAESGYREPAHLQPLHGLVDAVLIGSALMRGGPAASFGNFGRNARASS